jgi:trimethylamine:corrinoid methyltransferase-like protein
VDDDFSLMREIAAAGPAGNFLSSDLTLKNFRQAYFKSAIFPRFTMEDWQSQGHPRAEAYLSQFTNTLIEDLNPNDESFAIIENGEAFIIRITFPALAESTQSLILHGYFMRYVCVKGRFNMLGCS